MFFTTTLSVYDMDWTTILVAFIGFLGIFSGAYFGYLGQRSSRQINDAVNNRHSEHPKLYDIVVKNHEAVVILSAKMEKFEEMFCELPCKRDEE